MWIKCNCKIWKLGRCVRQEIGDRWRFLSTWFLKYISLNLESAMAEKLSNQTELWPGKWAMERQYGAPVAYRERQVMATLSWHKIGGHVTDRGWILNDKLTFILDQSKPYYWMIIQRWIQSRGRWRPLWHCLHWPVVGRESDSLQLLTEHHSYFSLHNNNDNNNNNNNNNSNNNDRLYCKIHSRAQ